jgi:hypothetical protein
MLRLGILVVALIVARVVRAIHNNPEVLRLRAINALNPQAQVVFCNSGDCPSILGGSFTAAPGR